MTQKTSSADIFTATLPCGMRVVAFPSITNVVYCGIAIKTGTRDELPHESGMAHFCEHLTFKGTHLRSSRQIINYMESVGGDLNAYTGKEETIYYTTFLKEHFPKAANILTDIVFGSTYPENEMNKEVEVVIDEIESYNDSPAELIFDEFESLIFNGHPLGRNILGEADKLRQFRSEDVHHFVRRNYRPENMVFFLYGQVSGKKIVDTLNKAIAQVSSSLQTESPLYPYLFKQKDSQPVLRTEPLPLPPYQAAHVTQNKDTHQAHVMIGTRAYSARDPRHIALYLLNNILGGPGMSSRFNLILRENNGLVYTVESNMTSYTDTGIWSVYFGCDPHDVKRCTRLIRKELERWTRSPISDRTLAAAKRQIKGQIGISYDNFENVALAIGKTYLHYHIIRNQEELYKKIDAVSAQELHQVACELFAPDKLSILIYQ